MSELTQGTENEKKPSRGGRVAKAPQVDPTEEQVKPASKVAPLATLDAQPSNKLPVKDVYLHAAVMFQGVTADHLNEAKHPGLKMLWVKGEGLLISKNGVEALIPAAGVKMAILLQKTNGRVTES